MGDHQHIEKCLGRMALVEFSFECVKFEMYQYVQEATNNERLEFDM